MLKIYLVASKQQDPNVDSWTNDTLHSMRIGGGHHYETSMYDTRKHIRLPVHIDLKS